MKLFKRIESMMKAKFAPELRPQPPQSNENSANLIDLINHAWTLKRAGQYDEVLKKMDEILAIADEKRVFGIRINQADILIRKKDFASAETILKALDSDPNITREESAHLANKWGLWWKAQAKWDEAQERFEESIELAKQTTHNNFICLVTGHLAHVYLEQGNATYALHLIKQIFPLLHVNLDLDIDSYLSGIYGLATLQAGLPDGKRMLEHALKLAQKIDHYEYQLLWLNSLAIEAIQSNQFAQAQDYLLRVLEKNDPTDQAYIQTLSHLSRTAYYLDDQTALSYAQQAEALLTEYHPERLKTQVYITLGIAYRINNDGANALNYLLRIDEDVYRRLALSSLEYGYVDYLRNLAGAYLLEADFVGSEQVYTRALGGGLGFDDLEIANIQRDKGIYHVHLRQYQDAIQLWMMAIKQYENQHRYAQVARLYCDIGNVRRLMGQGRRAFKDYEQALMVLNSFDDAETRGIVLSNAATIYTDYGDITTAESFFVEAIQISQQLRDGKTESIRRGNYGWFLLNTGRADSALHMLQHAVNQSQALDMPLHTAVQIDNIGLAWHELKNDERSLSYHTQSWELIQTQTGIDAYWRGIVGANLGHALISAKQTDGALELIEMALKIGREINRQELVIRALNGKIRLFLLQAHDYADDNHAELKLLAEEAVSLAHLQGRRRLLADALILRQQVYHIIGQTDEAQQDWEDAKSILRLLRLKPADYDYQSTER